MIKIELTKLIAPTFVNQDMKGEKKKMTPEELLQEIEENEEGIALDGYGEDK